MKTKTAKAWVIVWTTGGICELDYNGNATVYKTKKEAEKVRTKNVVSKHLARTLPCTVTYRIP